MRAVLYLYITEPLPPESQINLLDASLKRGYPVRRPFITRPRRSRALNNTSTDIQNQEHNPPLITRARGWQRGPHLFICYCFPQFPVSRVHNSWLTVGWLFIPLRSGSLCAGSMGCRVPDRWWRGKVMECPQCERYSAQRMMVLRKICQLFRFPVVNNIPLVPKNRLTVTFLEVEY